MEGVRGNVEDGMRRDAGRRRSGNAEWRRRRRRRGMRVRVWHPRGLGGKGGVGGRGPRACAGFVLSLYRFTRKNG